MTVPEWGSLLPRAIGRAMEEELTKRHGGDRKSEDFQEGKISTLNEIGKSRDLVAERRLGELLKVQKETVGLDPGRAGLGRPSLGGVKIEPPKDIPTLSDVGIDKKLSHRAQKMAAVPEERKRPCGSGLGGWEEWPRGMRPGGSACMFNVRSRRFPVRRSQDCLEVFPLARASKTGVRSGFQADPASPEDLHE